MNVVKKEADRYTRELENIVANVNNVQTKLSNKLYNFNREKDKLEFLSIVRDNITNNKTEHEKVCQGCSKSEDYITILYCIEQEYDRISEYYTPEIKTEDDFTTSEKMNLSKSINDILESLSHLKMGQELIYDEMDTLRQHFNIGKKNWFQLLQSKLIGLCATTVIEKTVADDIYTTLAHEVSNTAVYIGTQF